MIEAKDLTYPRITRSELLSSRITIRPSMLWKSESLIVQYTLAKQ